VTPEPPPTNGFEPSAAGWVAPPGHRRLTVSAEPRVSNCRLGVIGCSSPPLRLKMLRLEKEIRA
jgi:hypothetical protein